MARNKFNAKAKAKAPLKKVEPVFDNDPKASTSKSAGKRKGKSKDNTKNSTPKVDKDGFMIMDDTPKSFQRAMMRSKALTSSSVKPTTKPSESPKLKIKPGESMKEFSQRVNQALPVSHVKAGNGPSRAALKQKRARERVQKEQEAAKQRRRDAGEVDEDDEDEQANEAEEKRIMRWGHREAKVVRTKDGKRRREVSPDPWAVLESKKAKPKFGEVADAPPEIRIRGNKLTNVPKAAGSLAKRFMLQQERESVIENYRKLKEQREANLGLNRE